jgi:hypothetical protein
VAVIVLHRSAGAWKPAAVVRLNIAEGQIVEIADYGHCPWIVPAALVRLVGETA